MKMAIRCASALKAYSSGLVNVSPNNNNWSYVMRFVNVWHTCKTQHWVTLQIDPLLIKFLYGKRHHRKIPKPKPVLPVPFASVPIWWCWWGTSRSGPTRPVPAVKCRIFTRSQMLTLLEHMNHEVMRWNTYKILHDSIANILILYCCRKWWWMYFYVTYTNSYVDYDHCPVVLSRSYPGLGKVSYRFVVPSSTFEFRISNQLLIRHWNRTRSEYVLNKW